MTNYYNATYSPFRPRSFVHNLIKSFEYDFRADLSALFFLIDEMELIDAAAAVFAPCPVLSHISVIIQ